MPNPRSSKAKGRRLQQIVAKSFEEASGVLQSGDIKTAIMGEQGRDIILSPAAEQVIPFDIECKNVERLDLWGSIEQAETNASGERIPLLVFKRNRSDVYCVLKLDHLLKLLYSKED